MNFLKKYKESTPKSWFGKLIKNIVFTWKYKFAAVLFIVFTYALVDIIFNLEIDIPIAVVLAVLSPVLVYAVLSMGYVYLVLPIKWIIDKIKNRKK